ncbi:hypothetical protein [Chryseobacterium sp. 5_R23647]|uniref:hypothetical protein n=1 Tax=Chryseobacterium sp. 5_R23647 TaxID=2258964 RepID=UPI000E24E9D7|nr:hypothetical protein [Chryseobacterium sp. 5_R23647]REC41286.1 hypothetical protein DRF69_15610 [Chryseobacterium sp. 5_R23647]
MIVLEKMKRFMLGFFQNDKLCGYFYTENNDCNPSPDWNDILFGCGCSEVEPVTKKIQWKAG